MDLKERNENMREFFNRKIDTYDEVHSKFMKTKAEITERLNDNTEKVLDLGAGTGLELIYLFERFPKVEVTAIDITENMLKKLNKREFSNKVRMICGDFFEVEFGNEYDAVITTSALHHFLPLDKERLYKKIFKSLRNNGIFINADKIAISKEKEDELIKEYYEYKDIKAHVDTPLSLETEIEVLKAAGFSRIEIYDVDSENYKLIKATK